MTTRKDNGERIGDASFLRNTYLRLGWIERSHIPISSRSDKRSAAENLNLATSTSATAVEGTKLGVELIRKFFWRPRAEIEHYRALSLSTASTPISNSEQKPDSTTSEAINATLRSKDD